MQILFLERASYRFSCAQKMSSWMVGRRSARVPPPSVKISPPASATGRSGAKLLSCAGAAEAVIPGGEPFEKALRAVRRRGKWSRIRAVPATGAARRRARPLGRRRSAAPRRGVDKYARAPDDTGDYRHRMPHQRGRHHRGRAADLVRLLAVRHARRNARQDCILSGRTSAHASSVPPALAELPRTRRLATISQRAQLRTQGAKKAALRITCRSSDERARSGDEQDCAEFAMRGAAPSKQHVGRADRRQGQRDDAVGAAEKNPARSMLRAGSIRTARRLSSATAPRRCAPSCLRPRARGCGSGRRTRRAA